jgi:6-phosphogluconolactonase (cycloisomerase 2 family)
VGLVSRVTPVELPLQLFVSQSRSITCAVLEAILRTPTLSWLAFSPDESVLYIDDFRRGHIRAFDMAPNGTLAKQTDEQGPRHPGNPGLARPPVDHEHRGLHGLGT